MGETPPTRPRGTVEKRSTEVEVGGGKAMCGSRASIHSGTRSLVGEPPFEPEKWHPPRMALARDDRTGGEWWQG